MGTHRLDGAWQQWEIQASDTFLAHLGTELRVHEGRGRWAWDFRGESPEHSCGCRAGHPTLQRHQPGPESPPVPRNRLEYIIFKYSAKKPKGFSQFDTPLADNPAQILI